MRVFKACWVITAVAGLAAGTGMAQETVPLRGGVSIPEIPEYQDPFDLMIESVTSSVNTKLGAIPKPDSRAVVLDRFKITSTPGKELSAMGLIFACSKSQELNMEALRKYYSFVPEISVPTTAGECFLPEQSVEIDVGAGTALDLEDIISKFESLESVLSLSRDFLKPLSEEMKASYALEKSISDYTDVISRLEAKYGGIYDFIEGGGEYPAALWPSPGVTSSNYLPWYLEACNWIDDERRIRTWSEFSESFSERIENSPIPDFAIAADYRSFMSLRDSMSLPKMCSPSYRHTANIDSYFVYSSKSLRDFVNEKPFAFLISLSNSIKWMQQELEMTGPSLEVANAHSQILEDAAHKIIDLSEGHITSLSEEILEAKSLVDEHRAAITSRKEKIVEIASIVPLAERKLEENLFQRAEYRASISEIEVRQEEIQSRMDEISVEQKALEDKRRSVLAACGDLLDDCEFEGSIKKKHLWLDEIQGSQNRLSAELNQSFDELSSIGKKVSELYEEIQLSLLDDEALRSEIESATSGEKYNEKQRLEAEVVKFENEIATELSNIETAETSEEYLSRVVRPITGLVGR